MDKDGFLYRVGQMVSLNVYAFVNQSVLHHAAYGHDRPECVYAHPLETSTSVIRRVNVPEGKNEKLLGMVVRSLDAQEIRPIPDIYKSEQDRFEVYQILIVGDYQPLWFAWSEIEGVWVGEDEDG